MTSAPAPVRFGIVGSGWRAEFFARLAQALPARLQLTGFAVRRPETAEIATRRWGVPALLSPAELVRQRQPDFVVTCVPWSANEAVLTELVDAGTRVLSETPPAPDLDALRRLWARVGASQRVQVAEQYLLMPGHAARHAIVQRGAYSARWRCNRRGRKP